MNRLIENIISVPIWLLIFMIPSTLTHWQMVKESPRVKKLKRATYKELKNKIMTIEWEFNNNFPFSLFDRKDYNANYFHASIFEFNGVGYLLTPYGLLMANILQRRIRKTLPGYVKGGKPYIK